MTAFDEPLATALGERAEWLAWRKFGIGASDVAALVGMSKWASPMSVWTEKMGLAGDNEDNDFTEFGRRAEPLLSGYFEDRTGLFVRDQQSAVVHPDHPHHRATLDGRAYESPEGTVPLGVVEYKTTEFGAWNEIPDAYAIQVQWQMHVDQAERAFFGVLHGKRFATYEVERDDKVIGQLVEVVDRFWNDHVLTGHAPPADAHEATGRALAAAYPDPVEAEVPLDDLTWAIDMREQAIAKASEAKFEKAKAENAIKAALGDAEYGTVAGERIVSWKQQTRAEHTVKASTFRVIRYMGEKKP